VLRQVVEARRRRYGLAAQFPSAQPFYGVLSDRIAWTPDLRESSVFPRALAERRGRGVIAEVKLGSPRLGSLVGRVDPERQAELYGRGGAAALSVVVEPEFFFGSWELLRAAKAASGGLPTLAKDFVVSPRQLEEAAAAGADAILLIASLYEAGELRAWAEAARSFGLTPLVETHDPADLEALGTKSWEIVGVNNRDLRDFSVDLERSIALLPRLPAGSLRVAESGIRGRSDLDRLASAGFDAFLVGESLLLADDPAAALAELVR
jgi:indole-3-glycerol phosphate synthase